MTKNLKIVLGYFIFPVLIVLIHAFLLFFTEFYRFFPWFDIVMHLVGGFSISLAFFFTLVFLQKNNYLRLDSLTRFLFVIALVSMIIVLWEFFEFLLEYLTGMNFQGEDIMEDLFFGFFGGLIGAVSFEFFKVYPKSK